MILNKKRFKWLSQRNDVQDIETIISNIVSKKKINYFIEPFSGGLSTAVKVTPILKKYGVKHIIVNNVNQTVIHTYHYTRNNVEELFEAYWAHEEEVINLFETYSVKNDKKLILTKMKEHYEEKRKEFNNSLYENSIKHSALFLFLVNRSLNLTYSVNSKEEYVASFCNEIHLFEKEERKNTFKNYNNLFASFDVVFEKMNPFNFIDKYKRLHKKAIFYFDPDYSDTFFDFFHKNHVLIEAEQMSFTQFYKLFENLIIKKENIGVLNESLIETNNFQLTNDYYFKY